MTAIADADKAPLSGKLPEYPPDIVRDSGYRVYKDRRYHVYDDGNSAELPYFRDLAIYWESRCRLAVLTLEFYKAGGWASYADETLKAIGELPKESP